MKKETPRLLKYCGKLLSHALVFCLDSKKLDFLVIV